MSTFYGIVSGSAKTQATRRGSRNSGLVTEANTWTQGVRVHSYINQANEEVQDIYATTGSAANGSGANTNGMVLIATIINGAILYHNN